VERLIGTVRREARIEVCHLACCWNDFPQDLKTLSPNLKAGIHADSGNVAAGRAKFETMPNATGSAIIPTIGMVSVAALKASAISDKTATIRSGFVRTTSPASST
jgi:hypothetical protein